jgi:hypothetical protein
MSGDAFEQTREDLLARFGGLYEDELLRYVVGVDDTPENRQFFVDWKPTLRQRFEQIEIYITSIAVDVL